jgi:hypothetical protein
MSSTFSTNKSLELPANGDYVDTWNVPVNGDLTVIDTAFGGTTNLNATSGSATLTYTQYRPLILSVSGAVTANVTYTIPAGVGGQWIVRNNMTDSSGGPWDLIIASGGGGTSAVISRGFSTTIYSDGTNISFADSRLSTAAGSNRQIQYNNNGVLGASSTFVYDASGYVGIGTASPSSKLAVTSAINDGISVTDGTVRTVMYSSTAGLATVGTTTNHPLQLFTNNSFKMYIDTSGNVGIGTASPVDYGNTYTKQLVIFNTDQNLTLGTYYQPSTLQYSFINSGSTNNANPLPLLFQGGGIERMRIDGGGNFMVGVSSAINNGTISSQSDKNCFVGYTTNNTYSIIQGFGAAGTGSSTFYVVGSGQIYSTSTSIIAISDQTLKANVRALETGLAEVLELKPRRFDWSEDSINEGKNIAGFIAQEVQSVLPDLVAPYQYGKSETKLGLKMGDMIPTLVAAIQELSAKNDALEARLAKLENAQ